MAQINDYPFSSWKDYFPAFIESCESEYFEEKYPEYALKCAEYDNIGLDKEIVESLLHKGEDPQEGLDLFIEAMLKGHHYSLDVILDGEFNDIIKLFLDKGASIKIDDILKKDPYATSFEDEVEGRASVQGAMLCAIEKKFIPNLSNILDEKIGWRSIDGEYWENMLCDDGLDSKFGDIETARLKAIRYEFNHWYRD
jgi:hypothetical protein